MTKNTIGLYLIDNNIYICSKNGICKEQVGNNIIKYNRIADSEAFYKCINNLIKKNKLSDSFALKNVIVVEQPNYLKSDKEIISTVLEKIFNKVKFITYSKLLPEVFTITVNKNSILIPLKDHMIYINSILFEDKLNLKPFFKNNNKVFLIGNNQNIKEIAQSLENTYKVPVYWFANFEFLIINNLYKQITS